MDSSSGAATGAGDAVEERSGRLRALRRRLRANPATRQPYRVAVFVVGLLCIVTGLVLSVLPGPLTIPPVLLGLYVWSTEFAWAHRLFEKFKQKAAAAWEHARAHPVSSGLITAGGLVAAGVVIWAVLHYDLLARAKEQVLG